MGTKRRRSVRFVSVDLGYGPAEYWTRGRVISSQMTNNLFDAGQSEQLLVELPGGERIWAAYWRDDPVQ